MVSISQSQKYSLILAAVIRYIIRYIRILTAPNYPQWLSSALLPSSGPVYLPKITLWQLF